MQIQAYGSPRSVPPARRWTHDHVEPPVVRPKDQIDWSGVATVSPPPPSGQQLARGQEALAWQVAQPIAPLFGVGGLLFPDSQGQIKHMAFQLGNVEFDKPLPKETQNGLLGVWRQLFDHMSPETHFTVVCADDQGTQAVEKLVEDSHIDPQRVSILPAHSEKGTSIWIRDSMLPVRDENGLTKLLIQDRTYWPGPEDNQVAPLIDGAHPQIYAQAHPALRIDGGNILSNSKHLIIGSDSIRHTRARLQELYQDPGRAQEIDDFYVKTTGRPVDEERKWEELPKLVFESEFGKQAIVIARDCEQPAFHIDMTTTPIGDNKFLIGDPSLAIAELRKLSPEERARVNQSMAEQAGISSGEDLVEKLIEANSNPDNQAAYDTTARELAEAGYEIERMPALMGLRTTWSVPYLTYNNCMMENYQGTRKVYLPQYGCDPLDQMAEKIYQQNGFEVVPLQMGAISKLEGAIRCSSYALERDF